MLSYIRCMIADTTKDSFSIIIALITTCGAFFAALIGALAGKLWDANRDRKSKQHAIVIRYLSQLQVALQVLEDRLDNLTYRHGHTVMTPDYFRVTTLYALACPLAWERIFMLDGVYPQINEFNKDLNARLQEASLDKQLKGYGFHQYHRLALAECAMECETSAIRLATYIEFHDRYKNACTRHDEWLESAAAFADRLEEDSASTQKIMASLNYLADQLAEHTSILRPEYEDR